MEKEVCFICGNSGDIVCFCNSTILCYRCVGKHLISSPKQVHKPVLLKDVDMRNLMSSSWKQIKEKENQILSEAAKTIEIEKSASKRVQKELNSIDIFRKDSIEKIKKFCMNLKNDIDQMAIELEEKIKLSCENYKNTISADTSLIESLKILGSIENIEKSELTTSICSLSSISISKLLSESFFFELNMQSTLNKSGSQLSMNSNPFSLDLSSSAESPFYKRSRTRVSTKIIKKSLPSNIYSCYNNNFISFNIEANTSEVFSIDVDNKSVCTVVPDGSVIITGGDGKNSTFIFNIFEKTIEKSESMLCCRYNHAAVTLGDFVYVIGGKNENFCLKSCERFDFVNKNWQRVGDLVTARDKHSACVYRGRIFVSGGDGIDTLEVYNTVANKFTTLRTVLSIPGCSLMFSIEDFMIIFHDKSVSTFDPAKFTCSQFSMLSENEWYTNSSVFVSGKNAFFLRGNAVYKYNAEKGSIEEINNSV